MNSILIISEINDYLSSKKIHFSLTKGYEFAKGLSKSTNDIYYLTLGKSLNEDNLKFINIEEITNEFLEYNYNTIINKLDKYNFHKLTSNYWINLIKNEILLEKQLFKDE